MKFCLNIYIFVFGLSFFNFVNAQESDLKSSQIINCLDESCHPGLRSGAGSSLITEDLDQICQNLVRDLMIDQEITRGVQEKNTQKDLVDTKNVTSLCDDFGHAYLEAQGCCHDEMPKHCQQAYQQRLSLFVNTLNRDIENNKKTFISASGVQAYVEKLLAPFKNKYVDPIVCTCNLDQKLERGMYAICDKNNIVFDGAYSRLLVVFEAQKKALSSDLRGLFSRNKIASRFDKEQVGLLAHDLRLNRSNMRKNASQKIVAQGFFSDYFTKKEFDAYLELEMKEFIEFAKNISVSLWWEELSKHIDLSSKPQAQSKLEIKANKRHLLTPPACFNNN